MTASAPAPSWRRGPADPVRLLAAAGGGDRGALARLLSLVERGGPEGRAVAGLAYRDGHEAATVGVTGAPGAGKSTLVGRLVTALKEEGTASVAVLAVDPTSPYSGGAILGDRVRMQDHFLDPAVFIRSMATRGHLGGLAQAVPEAVRVLGACGFPVVVVETVGVGQVEVEVASATDTTVVVVTPGWGDAIQANKAGLLEAADVFVVNKADRPGAREARRDLEQMLDMSAPGDWRPPVLEVVAASGQGVAELASAIAEHRARAEASGELARRRLERLRREFDLVLVARITAEVARLQERQGADRLVEAIAAHRLDPYTAADELVAGAAGGAP